MTEKRGNAYFDIVGSTEKLAGFILNKGMAVGFIFVLIGVGIWASPLITDILIPLFNSLPQWAQIIMVGMWIAFGAAIVGAVINIIGELLGR